MTEIIGNIIIYAGEGAFKPSVQAIEKRLAHLDKQKYAIQLANEENFLQMLEKTNNIQLLVLSPGNAVTMYSKMRQQNKIANQIDVLHQNGMDILGICAGTILACRTFHERHASENALIQERTKFNLGICDGTLMGPFKQRIIVPTKNGAQLSAKNIEVVDIERAGKIQKAVNMMGPIFAQIPPDAEVLERYHMDVRIPLKQGNQELRIYDLKNPPSAIFCPRSDNPYDFKGSILLDANHPEFRRGDFLNAQNFTVFEGYQPADYTTLTRTRL